MLGLAAGAENVLVSDAAMRDPLYMAELFAEHEVSVSFITPKVLRYFKPVHSALRLLTVAGERLSGICPEGYRLVNGYGLSESLGSVFLLYS